MVPPLPMIQYPDPSPAATTLTIVPDGAIPDADPWNPASPKAKIPPSAATIQYPRLLAVDVIPTTDWLSLMLPVDPSNAAFPNEKMPPSEATSQ